MKILFVCLGNICRSPGAEGIMKKMLQEQRLDGEVEVDSAGIGRWHVGELPDPRMREEAMKRGIKLMHHCRQVRSLDFEYFDLIIGMDAQNIADLRQLAPTLEAETRVHSIGEWLPEGYDHVPDPYYGGIKGFDLALDLLTVACENILDDYKKGLS